MGPFASTIVRNKYSIDGNEEWPDIARRVVENVVAPYAPELVPDLLHLVTERKFIPGGRYLYGAGRRFPQTNNCFLFRAQDCRQGWGTILDRCVNSLMTGGGVGVVYSDLRRAGAPILGLGGKSTGPIGLMNMVNEEGRFTSQGGSRRSAIWAGLHWNHPDIFKFISMKDWPGWLLQRKREDFNASAPMDGTNISVILDDAFFAAYSDPSHRDHDLARDVYWAAVRRMLKDGEPGFSVDMGENEGENLRNACTEVTSRDDCDVCNLGSINLARIGSISEMRMCVELSTVFLVCGTLYSKLPVEEMYRVREKNRRLGLGLMGIHEWLLVRGRRYDGDSELELWLKEYRLSGSYANAFCDKRGLSRPVATRALAPNGTIAIAAETTSSGEPIPAVAYKRRYLDGHTWKAQYVIDPTAHRLIQQGVDPDLIEDSMTLAQDVERRMRFQSFLQRFVDHGISSTINLPPWGSEHNGENGVTRFGETMLKYLPSLRGVTAYPDGSRGGQPFVRVPYRDALGREGVEFIDSSEMSCPSGVCGG